MRAMLTGPIGFPLGFDEKPKPGREGITTSNASAADPPWLAGSVSGPMAARTATMEPGHPCVRISGNGVRPLAANVNEMDIEVLDPRRILREAVETRFRLRPTVAGCPVRRQLLHVIPVGAVAPIAGVDAIGKACFPNPAEDAVDRLARDRDAERTNAGAPLLGQEGSGHQAQ